MGAFDDIYDETVQIEPRTGWNPDQGGEPTFGSSREVDGLYVEDAERVNDGNQDGVDTRDVFYSADPDIEEGDALWPPSANFNNDDEKKIVQSAKTVAKFGIETTKATL